VLGECDAGMDGRGGCETMVMFEDSAPIVVESSVGDTRWAGTDGKL